MSIATNIPENATLFTKVVGFMNVAEANKELISTDKSKFVINCVLSLYPNLTPIEVEIMTQSITLIIHTVIAISRSPAVISEINKISKCCCF